jgi:hypothetical protein
MTYFVNYFQTGCLPQKNSLSSKRSRRNKYGVTIPKMIPSMLLQYVAPAVSNPEDQVGAMGAAHALTSGIVFLGLGTRLALTD